MGQALTEEQDREMEGHVHHTPLCPPSLHRIGPQELPDGYKTQERRKTRAERGEGTYKKRQRKWNKDHRQSSDLSRDVLVSLTGTTEGSQDIKVP